ncbi:hypothetical protein [Streptomyces sp. NPDC058385]|uniref:hypothetical protein n=1 Tax=Streptomyces sp. NPDC058385 TaxID=3346473 RepID=UPI003661DB07
MPEHSMHSSTSAPHETDEVQDDRGMRYDRHLVSDALPRLDKMVPRHQDKGLATTHFSRDSAGQLGECDNWTQATSTDSQ